MKINANSPKTLPFCGSVINRAGTGNAPGSTAYVNHPTGQTLDMFQAQVVQVGAHYALAAVVANEALGTVRVDHHLLNGSPRLTRKAKGPNRGVAAPRISVEEGARMVLDQLKAANRDQKPTRPSPKSPS